MKFEKNQKKVLNAWAFYDWANSVYPLVITSTVFPIYYNAVTSADGNDHVHFFGFDFINTVLLSYSLSFSFLLISILSPFLSGIADYTGSKKSFMKFFAYMGSASCAALYFFTGKTIELGIIFSVLASIGFSGSLVFYNAFLPEIATPDRHDKLSAKGYSMGYIGSVILLVLNLILIMSPEAFGFKENNSMPARISFISVGIWWAGFSQITFSQLPVNIYSKKANTQVIFNGFKELRKVWDQLQDLKFLRMYILAFFFYSMGVQTVMLLATAFGSKELGLKENELIISILTIQLVAIAGATFFARLSGKIGNIKTLIIQVTIWVGICIGAYFVTDNIGFFALAFFVGLVMGGIQSLSRSTYSKMLPETKDHASFFSFYDIAEKVAIVIGTASFGFFEELTGSMRSSVLAVLTFFVAGLMVLFWLNRMKGAKQVVD